jgi:hypothetical protein
MRVFPAIVAIAFRRNVALDSRRWLVTIKVLASRSDAPAGFQGIPKNGTRSIGVIVVRQALHSGSQLL